MSNTDNRCPLCDLNAYSIPYNDSSAYEFNCEVCGEFTATRIALRQLRTNDEFQEKKVLISCIIRERKIKGLPELRIQYAPSENNAGMTIQQIIDSFPTNFAERVDRALLNVAKLSKHTGHKRRYLEKDYPLFFVDDLGSEARNFMLKHLITEELITIDSPVPSFPCDIMLTSKGWNLIYELQKNRPNSNQGFIAMWFNPEMNTASEQIHRAITDAGFSPIRIDNHPSNNKICDEIIAEIRKSKFVVCDFTGQRGGVYFEAGYAMGLGLPVIWLCRKDYFKDLHFDTRQYNHIEWDRTRFVS
jgi:hypothetical protein